MNTPVIVEAVRTPIGKRGGALAGLKAVELLRHVQVEVIRRAGIAPGEVGQIIGGCVTQIGEQSLNVTRNAWLNSGWCYEVPASTVDASCGSAQQANHLIAGLIAAGAIDTGIACGVESMSRVPIGSNLTSGPGHYKTRDYPYDDPPKAQFGGAERIASREGITRRDADEYGLRSQQRAAQAWVQGRYDAEIVPITAPIPNGSGEPGPVPARVSRGGSGAGQPGARQPGAGQPGAGQPGAERPGAERPGAATVLVDRDEGLRDTSLAGLAALRPVLPGGIHTAGTTSQMSDGAAAILWMSQSRAEALGLRPRARLAGQLLTGADPYYLLDGPIVATRKILQRTGMSLADLDLYEVNEAFAAVVLAWARTNKADEGKLNPGGGAIALGHPLGASGTRLMISAMTGLERTGGEFALVTMCCGGSLGTASILQRM